MNERQRIQACIDGRRQAIELFDLLEWEDGFGADFAESLLKELAKLLPHRKKDEISVEQPTPIARLGSTLMPFGAYQGKRFDDVPLEYLDWLCRSQEDFYRDLRAYLKHPELTARRGH